MLDNTQESLDSLNLNAAEITESLSKNKAEEKLTNESSPDICLAAVQRDGIAIKDLTDAQRTPAVCLAAVKKKGIRNPLFIFPENSS